MNTTNISKRFEYYQDLDNYEDIEIRVEKVYEKWTPLKEFLSTDFFKNDIIHRTILSNEIIIDLDKPTIEDNIPLLLSYCQLLEDNIVKYYVYYSGGKGFHIHIFHEDYFKYFTELQIKQVLNLEINQRYSLIKRSILEFYKIDLKEIDLKIIDTPRKLIRAEGSKHDIGFYKTYIGSNREHISQNLKTLQCSEWFILDNIKLEDKLNQMSQPLHNYIIEKLNIIMEEEQQRRRQQQRNKLTVFKQNTIRPIVKDLFHKPLEDGRKIVLFIIIRELIGSKINYEDTIKFITDWNNLNHTKGSLNNNVIDLQIKNCMGKDIKPLRSETINQYLKQVIFK